MQEMLSTIKEYIHKKRLIIPLVVTVFFLVLVHVVWGKSTPRKYMYLNLVFYLFVTIFYLDFFKSNHILSGVKNIRRFLAFSFLSLCCLHLAYLAQNNLTRLVVDVWNKDGIIRQYVTETYFTFILYSFVMLILMPIGEELFFRYALISRSSGKMTVLTVVFSLLLYVAMNANYPTGLITLVLPQLVLTGCYLLTKNLYVTMLIHIIYSFVLNIEFIVYAFARMIYR